MQSWILILFMNFTNEPILLTATSREHCIEQMEMVRTIKGYERSECRPSFNLDEVRL